MTEDEKPDAKPDAKSDHKPELEKDARAEAGPSADTASPDEAQDATSESSEPAQEEVAEPSLEDRLAETNDQLLRALAELENTRRRADRDRAEALKYGAASFARDMLGVADNLQRALGAVAELDQETLPDAAKSLLEGVAATERDLIASLGRHKVQPLSPMGEKFDPNQHEAMFEAPGTGQPAGTIIEVIETGYVMDERLLRPAKVGIAKDD
jgi:molecular chaperone GrpE